MTTIAVMQPYWIPYAGYFRLLSSADVFVVFDDVQFPRRGYVHRNRLLTSAGEPDWITLPLLKASQTARISELAFHSDARQLLTVQQRKFPVIHDGFGVLEADMENLDQPVADLLMNTLQTISRYLGIDTPMIKSSELGEASFKGQDRIIRLVKAMGGDRYINASGGRELYQAQPFAAQGIELEFLPEWHNSFLSILEVIDDPDVRSAIIGD